MKISPSYFVTSIAIIASLVYFSSCSPVPYANVGQNVPLLKNKGEAMLVASSSATDDASGLGIQAALAVDSSWAIMTSFYSMKNNPNTDWRGRGTYFELGAGKFKVIGNSNFAYDVFAGVGFAGIQNNDGAGSSLDINFMKPFVQGSIGLATKWLDVAFTPRLAVPFYTNHENRLSDPTQHAQAETYFDDHKSKFVFEPGFTVRGGYRGFKANLNFCVSSFSVDEAYSDVSINNLYVGLGLSALISKRYSD